MQFHAKQTRDDILFLEIQRHVEVILEPKLTLN